MFLLSGFFLGGFRSLPSGPALFFSCNRCRFPAVFSMRGSCGVSFLRTQLPIYSC